MFYHDACVTFALFTLIKIRHAYSVAQSVFFWYLDYSRCTHLEFRMPRQFSSRLLHSLQNWKQMAQTWRLQIILPNLMISLLFLLHSLLVGWSRILDNFGKILPSRTLFWLGLVELVKQPALNIFEGRDWILPLFEVFERELRSRFIIWFCHFNNFFLLFPKHSQTFSFFIINLFSINLFLWDVFIFNLIFNLCKHLFFKICFLAVCFKHAESGLPPHSIESLLLFSFDEDHKLFLLDLFGLPLFFFSDPLCSLLIIPVYLSNLISSFNRVIYFGYHFLVFVCEHLDSVINKLSISINLYFLLSHFQYFLAAVRLSFHRSRTRGLKHLNFIHKL